MKKALFFIVGILLIALFTGCDKDEPEKMEPVPDIDVMEEQEENPLEEMVSAEARKPLVLKEGCFYNKQLVNYTKAGIMFYRIEFIDDEGTVGYNFTSKTDTTIKKLFDADVGVCIYQDRWQFFDKEGKLWSFRDIK